MKTIRIALGQINPTVGDLAGNTQKIINYIQKAELLGADIIAFPELSICGYPPEDLLLKNHFINKCREYLLKTLPYCRNITAVIGYPDKIKNNIFNSAAIINNSTLVYSYHKILLPNYGVFDEKRYFSAGNECFIGQIKHFRWSANICEDIWFPEGPTSAQINTGGAKLIINISASPFHSRKIDERKNILRAQAVSRKIFIAYCNMTGGQDELVFDGGSMIIDPKGKVISIAKQFDEDFVVADLSITSASFPSALEKSAPKYKIKNIRLKSGNKIQKPPLPIHKADSLSPIEEIYKALCAGLKDYVHKNGFNKVIFGLSGGIDSTLTALIAVDSLGKDNVTAVSMPSPFTSKGTMLDKQRVAKNLGIKLINIPITELFNTYLRILRPHFKGKAWNITEENIQARIRGNILMALSNKFGYLVLTTGNKSETSVGYCTLYGDMAGGFAVIKDISKELVYKLTEYRNSLSDNKLVPRTVFVRPPTAELKKNQKDQDTLPPYPVLDSIIDAYVERNKSLPEIIKMGIDPATAKRVIHLIDSNEYKRRQAPPGIKITPRAFGRDRRMPITNRLVV